MNWNLKTHIIGKVYDLTQENMNAMIADIESLESKLAKAESALKLALIEIRAICYQGDDIDETLDEIEETITQIRSDDGGKEL